MSIVDIDQSIFTAINSWNSPWADASMEFISSKFAAIPLYAFLLFLLIKKFNKQVIWVLLGVIILTLISDQTSVAVKHTVLRDRPCHTNELTETVHLVNNKCGGQYGFYSSHASNTMALAVLMSMLLQSANLRWFLFAWVFLVGYSRIYLAAHFPGDVLVGWLAGAAFAFAIGSILKKWPLKLYFNPNLL
jgi:undecaprenyl-diphosphatase